MLLEHVDLTDHHAAIHGLAHVVHRQQAELNGGQRLHFDTRAAMRLDACRAAHVVRRPLGHGRSLVRLCCFFEREPLIEPTGDAANHQLDWAA